MAIPDDCASLPPNWHGLKAEEHSTADLSKDQGGDYTLPLREEITPLYSQRGVTHTQLTTPHHPRASSIFL